jgi:diguanylate cyclase (GGDEF)-like protein
LSLALPDCADEGVRLNPLETQQLIIADQSATQRQLREGFTWLRFENDLEQEFRRADVRTRLPQIRFNLYLATAAAMAFAALNFLTIDAGRVTFGGMGLFAAILAGLAGLIAVASVPTARKIYPRFAAIGTPFLGVLVTLAALRSTENGAPVMLVAVLTATLYIYILVGLLFYQAIRTNIILWLVYVLFAVIDGLPEADIIYNSLVLLIINIIGISMAYGLEMESRTHFLERRLLAETAARDGLTGIHNRRRFDEQLQNSWLQAQREQVALALLMVDIDYFKAFNDRHGHQAGDECLKAVAVALSRAARRPLDLVARFGGEEFAIILYNPTPNYLQEISTRIHAHVAALGIPHADSSVAPSVTVSVGVAYVAPSDDRSYQGFLQLADEALYQAKSEGRNRSVFSEGAYDTLKTGAFRMSRRVI